MYYRAYNHNEIRFNDLALGIPLGLCILDSPTNDLLQTLYVLHVISRENGTGEANLVEIMDQKYDT